MITLAAAVAALFAVLVAFQAALALGTPLGRLAWGGAHRGALPPRLRAASALALLPASAAIAAALRAGGLTGWPGETTATATLYALGALFGLSLLVKVASSSPAERRLGVPLAFSLAAGSLALAVSLS